MVDVVSQPMSFMKRACTLVVVGVLCVLCTTGLVAASAAKQLYPACGGVEYSTSAKALEASTLHSFSTRASTLTLSCLAYEVISVKGGQKSKKDHCLIEHQTEYAYSLSIQGTYTAENGVKVVRQFPIRDMTGGSLTEIAVRMPAKSQFSFVFQNLATDSRCHLKVRAIFTYVANVSDEQHREVPAVVAVEPRTVYTKNTQRSLLVLYHGPGGASHRTDVVTLVDFSQTTCEEQGGEVLSMDYSSSLPASTHLTDDPSRYSARAATFYDPNTYRVCYRAEGAEVALQIAVITVFAGNPAYYEIISGMDKDGHVTVNVESTIKFYGYDLDTRSGGDAAKFVDSVEECDTGTPAGGVAMATDLEPEDNYGPNTTYSLWTWTMTEGGAFKVCYKRNATNAWTEVPFIEDVSLNPDTGDSTTRTDLPTPTDPNTGEACPMATPSSADHSWARYKSVQIVLASNKLPATFLTTISGLLCVPKSLITLLHLRHNKAGQQVVFLVLNCDEERGASSPVCDNTERYNYFVSIRGDQLWDHGIQSVHGSTDIFAFGDDEQTKQSSTFGIVMLSLCILAAGGMVMFTVARYHERRHHFLQFGLDEDEIDDMYDFDTAPRSALRNQQEAVPSRISNAVIEIED